MFKPMFGKALKPALSGLAATGVSGGTPGPDPGLTIPASLRQLLFHDDGTDTEYPAYYTELEWPNHSHLLKDYSTGVGTLREKRQGYCYDFDGVDDRVSHTAGTGAAKSAWSTYMRVKVDTLGVRHSLWAVDWAFLANAGLNSEIFSDNKLRFTIGNQFVPTTFTVAANVWYDICWVYDGTNIKVFVDNVNVLNTTALQHPTAVGSTNLIGYLQPSIALNGKASDLRFYDDALTDNEVAFLSTHGASGTDPGKANLVAHYPMQEESGTVCYDISGNGNHGTILNSQAGFHAVDAGVVKSYPNDEGYRLSGNVIIPAINSTTAADGNALTYTGRNPNYGLVPSPAWQGNDSDVYVDLGSQPNFHFATSDSFEIEFAFDAANNGYIISNLAPSGWSIYFNGTTIDYRPTTGTSTTMSKTFTADEWIHVRIAYNNGTVTYFAKENNEWVEYNSFSSSVGTGFGNLLLFNRSGGTSAATYYGGALGFVSITSDGVTTTFYPLEGTRDVAWIASNGTGGIIVDAVKNGTLESLYTDGDGSWRNPVIEHGGRYDAGVSSDAVLPGRPGTELAANGLALTIPRNKAPMTLDVNRTGGVVAPWDYQNNVDDYTAEAFDDAIANNNINKRLANAQYSDRYGAAETDISAETYFD